MLSFSGGPPLWPLVTVQCCYFSAVFSSGLTFPFVSFGSAWPVVPCTVVPPNSRLICSEKNTRIKNFINVNKEGWSHYVSRESLDSRMRRDDCTSLLSGQNSWASCIVDFYNHLDMRRILLQYLNLTGSCCSLTLYSRILRLQRSCRKSHFRHHLICQDVQVQLYMM